MKTDRTNAIPSAVERMDQRMFALSDRVDRSDERASISRPSEEPARGRSMTRRSVEENTPAETDDGDDGSDECEQSSDSDIPEGEPPADNDDPTGAGDQNLVRINTNPLRGENVIRTATATRRFKEQDTVKVPKFPILPNHSAWKLQVGKTSSRPAVGSICVRSPGGPKRVKKPRILIPLRIQAKIDSLRPI